MTEEEIIDNIREFVKTELLHSEGGHDWFHAERVWKTARIIARAEKVNMFIVAAGALLHDIGDHKFTDGDESIGLLKARTLLEKLSVDPAAIDHIEKIMSNISFKGGNFKQDFFSLELAVVQDADRLDALGAIGIARAFNYGGFKGRELYNPAIKPVTAMTVQQYQKSISPTINHFYEKLLLLKDRMNTDTGKQLALQRHRFMELYLEQFFREWYGDKGV